MYFNTLQVLLTYLHSSKREIIFYNDVKYNKNMGEKCCTILCGVLKMKLMVIISELINKHFKIYILLHSVLTLVRRQHKNC